MSSYMLLAENSTLKLVSHCSVICLDSLQLHHVYRIYDDVYCFNNVSSRINKIMFKQHGVCPVLSLTLIEIFASKYVWVTTLTFPGHVTSSVMRPIDSPYAMSYCCPIGTESISSTVFEISAHYFTSRMLSSPWSEDIARHRCQLHEEPPAHRRTLSAGSRRRCVSSSPLSALTQVRLSHVLTMEAGTAGTVACLEPVQKGARLTR